MKFRPCIDIHNGKVKQIVGGSLQDAGNRAKENFVSEMSAADYADLYKKKNLRGGHVILLNPAGSEYYEEDRRQAEEALAAYPDGLQVGGGITVENAAHFIKAGASHVIVTSYVFAEGKIHFDRLEALRKEVGKEHLVLDLSCRPKEGKYYIVTNRWQKFTDQPLDEALMYELSRYCDEYLVHGVAVEGTGTGIDCKLVQILSRCNKLPVTYAGGIGSFSDLEKLDSISGGKMDFTIGSALDLFGGKMKFDEVLKHYS